MNLQSVYRETLGQDFHDPPGIVLALKADDEVIGEPYDKTVSPHPRLHVSHEPLIQYMVQEYVRQAR